MSWRRYPVYRPVSIEWLGDVPAHWDVKPLSRVTQERCDGPFGSGLTSAHYVDEGARVVRLQNIRDGEFDSSDEAFVDRKYFERDLKRHSVCAGDLLIAGLGDENHAVGRACVAPSGIEPALVKADCFRFRLDRTVLPRFAALQLSASAPWAAGKLSTGSTRSRIPLSLMSSRALALPPIREQDDIVGSVDRESAKIDAMIAKQERLIELLQEKRQALITHAVTKGLDPSVPMKDSGAEWLGEVPAHWAVTKLGRAIERIEQGWSPECINRPAQVDEWGVLKAGCVNRGVFQELENKALPRDLQPLTELEIQQGDVLVSRASGSPDLVGSTAYVDDCRSRLMLSDKIFRIVLKRRIDKRFFVILLNSTSMRVQIHHAINGAEGLANNLPQSALRRFLAPIPPSTEQLSIATHVSQATTKMTACIEKALRSIELMRERRAALIWAAVTGKIDVSAP